MGVTGRVGRAVLVSIAIGVLAGTGAAASGTVSIPGRSSANVSIAADGDFVTIVWSASTDAGATDIYAAVSRDGDKTFASPSRVNSQPGAASVNGEQPPRVALVPRRDGVPEIVVIWTAKGAAGTILLTARSADSGRTFSSSTPGPGTDAPGNRGWQMIGTGEEGRVYAVWLDHRRLAAKGPQVSAGHHHGNGHSTSPAASLTAWPWRNCRSCISRRSTPPRPER